MLVAFWFFCPSCNIKDKELDRKIEDSCQSVYLQQCEADHTSLKADSRSEDL